MRASAQKPPRACYNTAMFIVLLWKWWYTEGWLSAAERVLGSVRQTAESFSVLLLLKTLFSPWKQTVNIPGPNTPLPVRLQWWLGNQISRIVGMFVRLGTLAAALLVISATILLGGAGIMLWPLVPLGAAILPILGVMLWMA